MISKKTLLYDGALIRGYRIGARVTQEELARLAGFPVRRVSLAERGIETDPSVYIALARELGLGYKRLGCYLSSQRAN